MSLLRYRPGTPLNSYVDCLWWSQRPTPQLAITREHMLPSGCAQIVFALHEAPFVCSSSAVAPVGLRSSVVWSRGIVHGPQWGHYVCGPKPAGIAVGVSFKPGAASAIVGVPMTEIEDQHVSIEALWGARGLEVRERLLAAADAATALRILEQELIARIQRPLLIHPAVAHALACGSGGWRSTRVTNVQREAGYSARHFIGLFRSAVGLTPKHYYRVKRFTTVLHQLAGGSGAGLAQIAAAAGYSDQSHLTREFREFAGITPTQYQPPDRDAVFHHRSQS